MWQPGEEKPADVSMDLGESDMNGEGLQLDTESSKSPDKKGKPSPSKRLSGSTMKMRFMQRKMEQRRKSEGDKMVIDQSSLQSSNGPQHDDSAPDETAKFQIAEPVDMYGPQANVLGRRSFGGFHKTIEDAWSHSNNSHSAERNNNRKKVSDEQLLKRYEDYVKGGRRREGSARPIGNLQGKRKAKSVSPTRRQRPTKR